MHPEVLKRLTCLPHLSGGSGPLVVLLLRVPDVVLSRMVHLVFDLSFAAGLISYDVDYLLMRYMEPIGVMHLHLHGGNNPTCFLIPPKGGGTNVPAPLG